MSAKMKENMGLVAIMLFVSMFIGFLWVVVGIDTQELKNNIELINPPQEVSTGQVEKLVITSVYSLKDQTDNQTAVVYFCSGKSWAVPINQIDAVERWLKSSLVPHKGCN